MGRLETALGALAESDSAEAHTLREALKQARRSAQEQPIIARSTHRLQVLAQKRNEEEQLLENAKARLERLRSSAPPVPHLSDLDVQVAELKAKLAVAEAERDTRAREQAQRQTEFPQEADVEVNIAQEDRGSKRPRHREDFIPHCDEEMQEWMEDRHKDLQMVMGRGGLQEVARVSHLLTTVAQEWQQIIQQQSAMPSTVANSVR